MDSDPPTRGAGAVVCEPGGFRGALTPGLWVTPAWDLLEGRRALSVSPQGRGPPGQEGFVVKAVPCPCTPCAASSLG